MNVGKGCLHYCLIPLLLSSLLMITVKAAPAAVPLDSLYVPDPVLAHALRTLPAQDITACRVQLRLIGAVTATDDKGYTVWKADSAKRMEKSSRTEGFQIGDMLTIEARNTGTLPEYLTLFDLVDAGVKQLYPRPSHKEPDNIIPADGKWHKLSYKEEAPNPALWRIIPPAGLEIYQAVVTERPLDFRAVVYGRYLRGDETAPILLLSGVLAIPGAWNTAALTFLVTARPGPPAVPAPIPSPKSP